MVVLQASLRLLLLNAAQLPAAQQMLLLAYQAAPVLGHSNQDAIGPGHPKVECLGTSVVLLAVEDGIELFDKEDTSADDMKCQLP